MARRSDHSREELREIALSAASEIVKDDGIHGLTTRAVAERMGYTVGTLYLIFHNLDDLIYAVNAQTVARLKGRIEEAISGIGDPVERLQGMAWTYFQFAIANPNLWRLSFEHQQPEGDPIPESITRETDEVLATAHSALTQLLPDASQSEIRIVTAAFWSGIHGVCHLTLTDTLKVAKAQAAEPVLRCQVDAFLGGVAGSQKLT